MTGHDVMFTAAVLGVYLVWGLVWWVLLIARPVRRDAYRTFTRRRAR